MKTKILSAALALALFFSCQNRTVDSENVVNDSASLALDQPDEIVKSNNDELKPDQDPFFPRFSISREEFTRMHELEGTPCNLPDRECEISWIKYLFDQPIAIQAVHMSNLKMEKGRYDDRNALTYAKLRGIHPDSAEGKVSGYNTVLYSIESRNPLTSGRTFYYDLASICPPPRYSCLRAADSTVR